MIPIDYSKQKQLVKRGLFYAEVNQLFERLLSQDGYMGVQIRTAGTKIEIIIVATRTRQVLGEKGRRMLELKNLVASRYGIPDSMLAIYVDRADNRALSAAAQAESLRYKLLSGLPVRRACYGAMHFIMDSGAMGCEIRISGKLRAQRAQVMKFQEGYMISSGNPKEVFIDESVRHVQLKSGILGVKVRIMKPHDPTGKVGPTCRIPDNVIIHDPNEMKAKAQAAAAPASDKPHGERDRQFGARDVREQRDRPPRPSRA